MKPSSQMLFSHLIPLLNQQMTWKSCYFMEDLLEDDLTRRQVAITACMNKELKKYSL